MITEFNTSEQRDPAEYVGLASPLPQIIPYGQFRTEPQPKPDEIIQGMLHQGCKLILGGTSKSNKSWCLIDLAVAVASGKPWWGHNTTQGKVLFINFELQEWAMLERLQAVKENRLGLGTTDLDDHLHIWNMRGHNADLSILRPQLEAQIAEHGYSMIIIDPAYKVLGDRDENANGEIASLMNEFERLAKKTKAAIVLAHHFAKGDSSNKNAIDRMSGAGAWARDPDAIIVLSPHEEPDSFTVTPILRNHKPIDEFVVRWTFPVMAPAPELNPEALRTPQSKNKKCTDSEFLEIIPAFPAMIHTNEIITISKAKFGLGKSSVYKRLGDLESAGKVVENSKKYHLA